MKSLLTEHPWWLDALFYQIYPQSFYDSNNDGIGDLEGIRRKLDYIQHLGIDAVWLNPIFVSPFKDAGYDVADYRNIAPRYGKLKDLQKLIKDADKRGIRILLDLVFNHTSDEHPWFQASRRMGQNPFSKWYAWSPRAREGKWITNDDGRHDLYLTQFHTTQVSVNLGHKGMPKGSGNSSRDPDIKRLHKEFQDITAYWLDQGVSGFRCDVPGAIGHRPFGNDEKVLKEFWNGIRRVCDRYGDVPLIAEEWGTPLKAVNDWGFHMTFSGQARVLRKLIRAGGQKKFQGDPRIFDKGLAREIGGIRSRHHSTVLYSGNHDFGRISRSAENDNKRILLAMVSILTQDAVPKIYYGDEIGMLNDDSVPWKEWSFARAAGRTPMQWTAGTNAGFSRASASKLYLPVSSNYKSLNVAQQINHRGSLLEQIRNLIQVRRDHPSLHAWGKKITLWARNKDAIYAYARQGGGETTVVVLNFFGQRKKVKLNLGALGKGQDWLPASLINVRSTALPRSSVRGALSFELGPYGFQIFSLNLP